MSALVCLLETLSTVNPNPYFPSKPYTFNPDSPKPYTPLHPKPLRKLALDHAKSKHGPPAQTRANSVSQDAGVSLGRKGIQLRAMEVKTLRS